MSEINLPSAEELRAEVRAWLEENWTGVTLPKSDDPWVSSPERIAWLEQVVAAGYGAPTYPSQWFGRAYPNKLAKVIAEEFRAAGAPGACQDRFSIPANTTLAFGTEALKSDLLYKFLTEKARTCLLYSEPGAGSDLAGVRTTAVRDGDRWVINGQKVWTSGAKTSQYALLIARTDWDVPKHKGITFFIVPMNQPGIEIRPLVQITGDAHFNEVFITDATVPDAYVVGGVGNGWRVLQTALAVERSIMGSGTSLHRKQSRGNSLVEMARTHGKLGDAAIRRSLADVLALRELNSLNNARAKAEAKQGTASPVMSLGKLATSRILHAEARLKTDIIGADALLAGPDNAEADEVNFLSLNAFFTSIGGGTDQIQRNIIGERVLGLPREPEVDRDIPFREIRKN
ncbi:acyl-CoA dehydrogenase family protein [Mycolicibacterium neoaurum]|uniref:acyl-CoA dehydrogenase family protein n=1 Tax=Mycolicibacterium neoaurum TaxID=1795 RepID=UPI001F4CB784|nr:acyl-CoA dehydrogenase family protein [Mycolicibacterium neoaurum]